LFDPVKPNLIEPILGSGLTPLGLGLTMVKPSPNGVWFDLVISNQIKPALGLVWLILDSVWPRSNLAKHRTLLNPIKSNLTKPKGSIWLLLGFFFFFFYQATTYVEKLKKINYHLSGSYIFFLYIFLDILRFSWLYISCFNKREKKYFYVNNPKSHFSINSSYNMFSYKTLN